MPPKTVTCAVCKETVLKAHTFARKDGSRACRNHPGVEEEAKQLHAEEVARLAKPPVKQDRGWRPQNFDASFMRTQQELIVWRRHLESHCWVCDAEGTPFGSICFKYLLPCIDSQFEVSSISLDYRQMFRRFCLASCL